MSLVHLRAGSGPPLLLVHGLGMSRTVWEDVVPPLAGDFECFAVDLPGFGASPPLDGPATMTALGAACTDFMASQGHPRFAVAGNSLGGGIALWLALTGRATAACGLSPVGFTGGWDRAWLHLSLANVKAVAPALERATPVLGRPAAVRRALLAQYATRGERRSVEQLVAGFRDLNGAVGFHDARRHAVNWRCPAVEDLPCPVTIAWGEKDRLLLRTPQAARARERLPAARHLTLEGCGHLPGWDDPALTARVVRQACAG